MFLLLLLCGMAVIPARIIMVMKALLLFCVYRKTPPFWKVALARTLSIFIAPSSLSSQSLRWILSHSLPLSCTSAFISVPFKKKILFRHFLRTCSGRVAYHWKKAAAWTWARKCFDTATPVAIQMFGQVPNREMYQPDNGTISKVASPFGHNKDLWHTPISYGKVIKESVLPQIIICIELLHKWNHSWKRIVLQLSSHIGVRGGL